MAIYRHTQRGTLVRWALGGALAVLLGIRVGQGMQIGPADAILAAVGLLVLAALILMHSLTVTVDDLHVTASLGPGLIRRSVRLNDIGAARHVRNGWYYGWGLRLTARGPLWRVSGFDAVELELVQGRWLIGTDDPEGLLAAIWRATEGKRLSTV
ncbi:MAG: hypothetical protein R6X16_11015 [Anaerolineae bacterium]